MLGWAPNKTKQYLQPHAATNNNDTIVWSKNRIPKPEKIKIIINLNMPSNATM